MSCWRSTLTYKQEISTENNINGVDQSADAMCFIFVPTFFLWCDLLQGEFITSKYLYNNSLYVPDIFVRNKKWNNHHRDWKVVLYFLILQYYNWSFEKTYKQTNKKQRNKQKTLFISFSCALSWSHLIFTLSRVELKCSICKIYQRASEAFYSVCQ